MPKSKRKKLSIPLHPRDVSYFKPDKFKTYLTLSELSRAVGKETSWLRHLEKVDRIPRANRVQCGELLVRLWSPGQVEEIKTILATMKPGRKRNEK